MRLTRPARDASPADVQAYHRALARALEGLGVDYGQDFEVGKSRTPHRELYELAHPNEDAVGGTAPSPASINAALQNLPASGSQRDRILRLAVERREQGVTSDEASAELGIQRASAKPRFVELRVGGWLRLDGRTRKSAGGGRVEVHVATEKALASLGLDHPKPRSETEEAQAGLFTAPRETANPLTTASLTTA